VAACRGEEVIGSGKQPRPISTAGSAGTAGGSEGGSGGDTATGTGGVTQAGAGGSGAAAGGNQTGGSAGQGGRAGGGRGGAAGAASMGQGGEDALPLPEDCTPRDWVQDGMDECGIGLACATTWTESSCYRLPSGRWQCSCAVAPAAQAMEGQSLELTDRVYEIGGASGIAVCAVAAGLCSIDENELELGAETCADPTHQSGPNECETELSCGRSLAVPFAPDVEAWLMQTSRANCTRESDGSTFSCTCGHAGTDRSNTVVANDASRLCQPYLDFCIDTPEPTFDGPAMCFETASSAGATECRRAESCSSSIALDDDASVVVLGPVSTVSSSCSLGAGSYCNCIQNSTKIFNFEVGLDPTSETCAIAARACHPDAMIEAQGEPECIRVTGGASENVCQLDQYCDFPATVDGQEIVTRVRPHVTCNRVDAVSPWQCACAWNGQSVTFDATAEPPCSAVAADRCLELLPLVLGPGFE
jgi:hypothetical protein